MKHRAVNPLLTCTVLSLAVLSPAAARASLITNGSFETGTQLTAGGSEVSTALPSWNFTDTTHHDRVRAPSGYGGYPTNASHGDYYVGINWSPALGVLDNRMWQPFTLGSGATGIDLSFDMSAEMASLLSSMTVEIRNDTGTSTMGSNVLATSAAMHNTLGVDSAGRPQWSAKSFSTDLAAGNYQLVFHAVTDSMAYDVLIDNVVLNARTAALPEPGSLALAALALAGLGLARRRSD